jgi:hypothetical protein
VIRGLGLGLFSVRSSHTLSQENADLLLGMGRNIPSALSPVDAFTTTDYGRFQKVIREDCLTINPSLPEIFLVQLSE